MSKHDIILIIFKLCVSKIYLIVLIPNLECTDDQIYYINKCIRYLYWELFLFIELKKGFWYIPDNEIVGDILGCTTSLIIYTPTTSKPDTNMI